MLLAILVREVGAGQRPEAFPIACPEEVPAALPRAPGSVRRDPPGIGPQRRDARPGLVDLVEVPDVLPPPGPVHGVLAHGDARDLERPVLFGPHPLHHGERPPVIEGKDMIHAKPGIGSEIEERADARHVLVARAGKESEGTMVLHDEVGGEHGGELLPVPRVDRSPDAPVRLPDASVGAASPAAALVELP
jgi:hypothetical protein